MNPRTVSRLLTSLALAAAGAVLSAQTQMPGPPLKSAGGNVTPVFEGWYDNADGTHSFLIGYYSRNTQAEVDIPIGPANHFDGASADLGQPTHFLPSRRYGIFTVTVPKEWGKTQKLTWTLTINGATASVPFYMHPDYNVSPFRSSEEAVTGGYNTPPVIRFDAQTKTTFAGPAASLATAIARTATVGAPMALDVYAEDDALYASATAAPMSESRAPVTLLLAKYRGPGDVVFADARPKLEALKGGKPAEPFSGKASTTVKFSEAGDYMLHVTANDYSGNGGGGSVCCWTTAIVKVQVKGQAAITTGQ